MLITAAVIVNKKEYLNESTHLQQSNFIIHDTGNMINYTE